MSWSYALLNELRNSASTVVDVAVGGAYMDRGSVVIEDGVVVVVGSVSRSFPPSLLCIKSFILDSIHSFMDASLKGAAAWGWLGG